MADLCSASDRNQPVTQSCPVCANPGAVWHPPLGDREDVDCPSCGKIRVSGSAEAMLVHAKISGLDVAALSRRLRDHPRHNGERLCVTTYLLEQLEGRGGRFFGARVIRC